MMEESATCVICNATLTPLERREGPVCLQASCRWSYRAIPRDQRCRTCGRPLAAKDRAAGVCGVARCQHAAYAGQVREARERWERERSLCCICSAPLSPLDLHGEPVCGRQECRWAYQALPRQHICPVCGRPLSLNDRPAGVCGVPPCQHALQARQAREARERRDNAAHELYQLGIEHSLVPEPETYPITHLPSSRRKRTRLPKWRQREFQRHLQELIAEVVAAGWDTPASAPAAQGVPAVPASPELDAVSGRACAGCQGHCCLTGGTHAYMTPATIRRYHEANPAKSPAEVEADYLARLRPLTYKLSCVFHGRQGCHLPREMRADLCNQWFCSELRGFRAGAPADKPVRAFMIWPEEDAGFSAAFVDATRTRPVHKKTRRKKG